MERPQLIEKLFHEAREHPADERNEFLRQACKDETVVQEVLSLIAIAHSNDADDFEASFAEVGAQLIAALASASEQGEELESELKPGDSVDRYRILSPIGKGGTGRVYRAFDPKIHREVAIKICYKRFDDRLPHEMRTLAALNHPNICQVYDVGQNYLVMELIEGESPKGLLPLERALDYSRQIADALEAAHEKGIVHRDLKPGNIKVRPDGIVKVLDFGFAKRIIFGAQAISPEGSPTMTMTATPPGFVAGTPAYMSPEQCRGETVDRRTDIWSFGAVLYEMLTGKRAFEGQGYQEIFAAVIKVEPDWRHLPQNTPATIRILLRRCLTKDPRRRLQAMGEARIAIEDLKAGEIEMPEPQKKRTVVRWVSAVLGVVLMVLMVILARHYYNAPASPSPVISRRLAILPLQHLGKDKAPSDWGADRLIEAVAVHLARSPKLTVYGSPVTRLPSDNSAAVAKTLDAELLLSGTVDQQGNEVALAFKLQDANGGKGVWNAYYSTGPEDVFQLHSRLYEDLMQVLGVPKSPETERETTSDAAYALYLEGRKALADAKSKQDLLDVVKSFDASLREDHAFCTAQAGIADAFIALYRKTNEGTWSQQALNAANRTRSCNKSLNIPEVHFTLGSIYTTLGQYEDAVRELREILAELPNSDDGYRRLGFAYYKAGRMKDSIDSYQLAVKINPNYWNTHYQLGNAYYQFGDNQNALKHYNKVKELEPAYSYGYEGIGNVSSKLGEYRDAIDAYNSAIGTQDNASSIYSNLGTALFYSKRVAEARQYYQKAISLEPNDGTNYGNLGDAYRALKKEPEAAAAYSKAISLLYKELNTNPRSASAMGSLALYHAKSENTDQAIKEISDARAAHPDDADLIYNSAIIFSIANRHKDALEMIRLALTKGYSYLQIDAEPDFESLKKLPEFQDLRNGKFAHH